MHCHIIVILAIGLFFCGCAGPSMAGFPHSNMHPVGGNEIAFAPHGGGWVTAAEGEGRFNGGGMFSYAHDFGDIGMSIAAGAYLADKEMPNIHGHIEIARKGKKDRNDVLAGIGYSDNYETRVPQLSVGFLHGSHPYRNSGFAGFRFSMGPIFEPEPTGAQIFLSGAFGYQWRAKWFFGCSIQLVPLVGIYVFDSPSIILGGMAMFSFMFRTG